MAVCRIHEFMTLSYTVCIARTEKVIHLYELYNDSNGFVCRRPKSALVSSFRPIHWHHFTPKAETIAFSLCPGLTFPPHFVAAPINLGIWGALLDSTEADNRL